MLLNHHQGQADFHWLNAWRMWHHEDGRQVRSSQTQLRPPAHREAWGSSPECRSFDGWPLPRVDDLCRSHSGPKRSSVIVETLSLSSCSHPKVLFQLKLRRWSVFKIRGKKERKVNFSHLNLTLLLSRITSLLCVRVKIVPHHFLSCLFTQVFTFLNSDSKYFLFF